MPLYRAELLAKKPLWHGALIHDVSCCCYLPFDYDDGSYARDRSGYQNHSTIYGATRTSGKIGAALSFNGTDDYVKHADGVLDLKTKGTWSHWIFANSFPSGMTLMHYWAKQRFMSRDGKLSAEFLMEETGAWAFCTDPNLLELNKWLYISVTHDKDLPSKSTKLFINAKQVMAIDNPYTIVSPPPGRALHIGSGEAGASSFDGVIDEVRVYNRPVSQDEIRMLMYRGL